MGLERVSSYRVGGGGDREKEREQNGREVEEKVGWGGKKMREEKEMKRNIHKLTCT